MRRALIASLCLHALATPFIPIWTRIHAGGLRPVETISFARLERIRIERPQRTRALAVAVPRNARRAPDVAFARVRAELAANKPKPDATRTPTPQAGPRRLEAAAPKPITPSNSPVFAQAPVARVPVSTTSEPPIQAASPDPQATVAERIVAADRGSHNTGGVMPFGADLKEPVLDPAVKMQLQRRFAVHVTLTVTVGDNGRTKRVVFAPPIDAQMERQIESLLADANWDAAVCGGGIACEATAVIKL
ncbi:MAG TPA: hypothetical protein VIG51_04520 [Candidatus Baltobacteraceae bacterium]